MGQNLESSGSTGYKKWILFIGASVSCFLMGYAIQGDGGQKYLLAAGGFLFVISAFLGLSGGTSRQAELLNIEHLKKEQEQRVLKDHLHKSNSIVHVFSDVSKLWDSNIEVSRKTTEDSIRSLSEKFSQIYSSIDAVVVHKQHNENGLDANQQMFQAVDKSEEKLSELNNIFGVMQSGRRQLVDMVKGLAAHMEALSGMASEVSSIAAQTNLLALNAAIEAARAGESGRGFAVVADAVRTLSTRSSDTGKKMSESVDVINSSIKELVHLSDSSIDSDNQLIEDSGQTVKDILLNLKSSSQGLVASTEQIKEQGVYVQREISDVIVALQFQDRVSQILTHVRENMNSLMCKADAYLSDPDSESALALDHWLKDMEVRYATQEQRSIHSGHKPLADNNQDITFF